ncbi:MAG: hypothetical protein K2Y37_25985 [Pirellulales bacterium]|nr:hypothetical protein [Pirellulales bacterium]
MSFEIPSDVERHIQRHMALGGYASPEDVLRDALEVLDQFTHTAAEQDAEFQATVEAVREGLADFEAGRMRPLRVLIDEARHAENSENA